MNFVLKQLLVGCTSHVTNRWSRNAVIAFMLLAWPIFVASTTLHTNEYRSLTLMVELDANERKKT